LSRPAALTRPVEDPALVGAVLAVIAADAVVLGVQTHDGIEHRHAETLEPLSVARPAVPAGRKRARRGLR
jgi:hypothetical protein